MHVLFQICYVIIITIIISARKRVSTQLYSSCGGSIIADSAVLTAGHCLRKGQYDPNRYFVRAGTSTRDGLLGSRHRIKKIIKHENYFQHRRIHSKDDIAILLVDPPFKYDKTRQKIPIAVKPAKPKSVARLSGWGFMDLLKTQRPRYLQATNITLVDRKTCNEHSNWKGMIEDENFCGSLDGSSGSCQGDSGGPLVQDGKLVGMVSWGMSAMCSRTGNPSVFTNVTSYVPWIRRKTKGLNVTYL